MTDGIGGSLRISTEAIAKIAKVAALEVDGIDEIVTPSQSIRALLGSPKQQKPIRVEMKEDLAEITIHVKVAYGTKVNLAGEKVQENVKSAVQSMTGIMVSRVNIVVDAITGEDAVSEC